MYSNCYTYQRIVSKLNKILTSSFLISCFSTGKDELILQFLLPDKTEFQWNVKFVRGEMFFRFSLPINNQGKKAMNQFKSIENRQVIQIYDFGKERALSIKFQGNYELIFAGFGRMGDVICTNSTDDNIESFRNHKRSNGIALIPKFCKISAAEIKDKSANDLQFLSSEMKIELEKLGFDTANDNEKWKIFEALEQQMLMGNWFSNNTMDPPQLSYFDGTNKTILQSGLEGIDFYASQYIQRAAFIFEKEFQLKRIEKDLIHFKKLQTDNLNRSKIIQDRRSFKELGDIIMSFAHSIKPGVSTAFLTDYYTGNQIRIKLNPNLSAAENAEKHYRKAKNEILEFQHAEKNAASAALRVKELQMELETIVNSQSFKQLSPIKSNNLKIETETKPYKEVKFMDFTIWIGKNAKGNDEMLKLAAKNDLWLHARNTAGSHIIIKKQGATFPEAVVQYAAKLAAQNSKAKSQKIVPVIAVERKYVTKGKLAKPGEVKVLKEIVVDAHL